jgi:small subunit ribosomal protein S2
MAVKADIKELFEAGAHFGHKTSRWNPKMAKYIHSKRQDIHIIDLAKTVIELDKALPFLTKIAASGKKVLFVGTKKQARDTVREVAESIDQPYVTERWIGGMLTNVATINKQLKKLHDLEKRMQNGDLEKRYSKLEVLKFQEEIDSLNTKYSGIKDLNGKPGAIFIVDTVDDINAVKEATVLNIPVVGIVDTNANPDGISYPIPANDDALKSVKLILDYAAKAIEEGSNAAAKVTKNDDKKGE